MEQHAGTLLPLMDQMHAEASFSDPLISPDDANEGVMPDINEEPFPQIKEEPMANIKEDPIDEHDFVLLVKEESMDSGEEMDLEEQEEYPYVHIQNEISNPGKIKCKGCGKYFLKLLRHMNSKTFDKCRPKYSSDELNKYLEEGKEKKKAKQKKYSQSEKGKLCRKKYSQTEKGKARHIARQKKYSQTKELAIEEEPMDSDQEMDESHLATPSTSTMKKDPLLSTTKKRQRYYEKNEERIKRKLKEFYELNKVKSVDPSTFFDNKQDRNLLLFYMNEKINKEKAIEKRNKYYQKKEKNSEIESEEDRKEKKNSKIKLEEVKNNAIEIGAVTDQVNTEDFTCDMKNCMANFWFKTQLDKHMEDVHRVIKH